MNQKRVFGKSLSFLIAAVLAIMAFVRGPLQVRLLAGTFAVWGIFLLGSYLLSKKPSIKQRLAKQRQKRQQKNRRQQDERQFEQLYSQDMPDPNGAVLLRHVNHRISAYLKSAYADVTWEWCTENPAKVMADGKTGRIRLFGVSDFNYADVMFDQLARINCDMLRIVPFAELKGASGEAEPKPGNPEQPVDPSVWYSIQGKSVLESCVADLHSQGYASLTIKESGDICIRQEDIEVVHSRVKNFPGKGCWKAIIKLLEGEGLAATAVGDGIKVSW